MKKLLSPFRASGHVTKVLKVTQNEITVQVLRDIFGIFRARLDFDKKMADLEKKYPKFFTEF